MPTPGGVFGRRPCGLSELFEDRLSGPDGIPGPVVDTDDDPIVLLSRPDADVCSGGVPDRVRDQVLDDPFHLRSVDRGGQGTDLGVDHPRVGVLDLGDDTRDQGRDVGLAALGRHDAALETIQVEEIAEQALELSRVGGDPVDEVEGVGRRQLQAALLERERRSEDRGQRGP
jgi:hypothetical protein